MSMTMLGLLNGLPVCSNDSRLLSFGFLRCMGMLARTFWSVGAVVSLALLLLLEDLSCCPPAGVGVSSEW